MATTGKCSCAGGGLLLAGARAVAGAAFWLRAQAPWLWSAASALVALEVALETADGVAGARWEFESPRERTVKCAPRHAPPLHTAKVA